MNFASPAKLLEEKMRGFQNLHLMKAAASIGDVSAMNKLARTNPRLLIDPVDGEGSTVLHVAADSRHVAAATRNSKKACSWILSGGDGIINSTLVDVNGFGRSWWTPLHAAVASPYTSKNQLKTVKVLMDAGADANIRTLYNADPQFKTFVGLSAVGFRLNMFKYHGKAMLTDGREERMMKLLGGEAELAAAIAKGSSTGTCTVQ